MTPCGKAVLAHVTVLENRPKPVSSRAGARDHAGNTSPLVRQGAAMTMGGAGANVVSGVLSEASCRRCEAWRIKKEADLF